MLTGRRRLRPSGILVGSHGGIWTTGFVRIPAAAAAKLYFEVNDFRLAQIHYEMAAQVDPAFANVYFNLALVQAINNELAAAFLTLTTYKGLVPEEDGRNADELLQNLKKSLAASKEGILPLPSKVRPP